MFNINEKLVFEIRVYNSMSDIPKKEKNYDIIVTYNTDISPHNGKIIVTRRIYGDNSPLPIDEILKEIVDGMKEISEEENYYKEKALVKNT